MTAPKAPDMRGIVLMFVRAGRLVAVCSALALGAGCIVVVKDEAIAAEPAHEIVCTDRLSVFPALSVTVTGVTVSDRKLQESIARTHHAIVKRIDAHPCMEVSPYPVTADRVLDIRSHERVNPRLWLAFLSGLTLTLLPTVASIESTMTVTVMHGDRVQASRHWYSRAQLWFELFLVFAMPSAGPKPSDAKQREAMAEAVVGVVESVLLNPMGMQ
ncbi:hypothetical protein [Nannocystis pusilla]|uniref:Lipoprotein n=1 Tax=Nannocystis pusilla TaxID=889268 RepID=A0ABS7TUF0_9BACT|nr:hypothetical protein [Nannocystis pusilla]MBZ5711878.1 hypothetical protein [Nannocystis pusilla]